MSDQEKDITKASNQNDISIASSSKQEVKAKKPNQGLRRPRQVEQEKENETETQEELEEVTRQSNLLKIFFSYFDSKFQEIQSQIRKIKDKEQVDKKRKFQVETFKKKVTGCNTNITQT